MATYDASTIEKKWQKKWAQTEIYKIDILDSTKPRFFNLVMFPYPSGDKLHVGHWYNFAPADSYGRYKRLNGYRVFQPFGYDSFGLPAENYAIKKGIHPQISIAENTTYMRKQISEMGAMYDFSKEVNTSTPEYYKWTQWIFLQLYKKGLAYRKNAPVNWCPSCQTVLANEQVQDGICERCKSVVTKKDLTQWFFRIRDYAERLLQHEGLDWPEKTKLMQQHWIGKSTGSEIKFDIVDENGQAIESIGSEKITVFTTRIDTLYGVTYVVLAPEHDLVDKLTTAENKKSVADYIELTRRTNDIERAAADRPKTGVFTGSYAVNPVNGVKIPIWIGDYVLISYGTGAVMAVPAHDERDFAFAKKYNLEIKEVIAAPQGIEADENKAFTEDGILINSDIFTGLSSEVARGKITEHLEKNGQAKLTINYKLRDWLLSRQRYWGAPIPVIYCDKCGELPVPEDQLPVELPYGVDFTPKGDGKSPLNTVPEFVNTTCYKCGSHATREVDTMDTFVDSSWYFLRYPSVGINDKPFDPDLTKKWLPVDMYVGGPEHACMHLLYARFINKALFDLGFIDFDEPFKKLVHQGMITKDGAKMSKSKGNVVSPDSFVEKYGSDTLRMYLMFMGPYSEGGDWNDNGIKGVARFVERFYSLISEESEVKDKKTLDRIVHKSIKKITDGMEKMQFNTSIATLMEFVNNASKTGIDLENKKLMTVLISPFAPHLAEELWETLGEKYTIFDAKWPIFDETKLEEEEITLPVQINGKLRGQIKVAVEATKEEILSQAKLEENVSKHLVGKTVTKEIYVPKRMVNLVVSE